MGLSQDTSQVAAGFHSRNTTLAPMEQQDLKIRGYSDEEIARTVRALQDRNVEPTHADVRLSLSAESAVDASLFDHISEALHRTSGVQGKLRLAQSLKDYAESLTRKTTEQLNEHYQSLWPEPRVITAIVDRWPVQLQEQACYIKSHWPKLLVRGMRFKFTSTSEVCSNDYGSQLSPLGYLAFFRLVKDIWFHAVSTSNTCIINRISHLLISFAKEIADNTYISDDNDRTRRERFESVIHQELKRGISSTYDIGAFAFLLVAYPSFWRTHNSETLRLMANRAFNGREEKLAPYYSQWQSRSRQDQVSKTVELEIIPSVAMAMHYLHAIHNYLITHKAQKSFMRMVKEGKQISDGNYFDRVTHQLAHPIPAPEWRTSHPLSAVKETLREFYANPIYQKLFLGTEEFKAYQKEQRRLYTRQRFREAIKKTICQNKAYKAGEIKKQFKAQEFKATRDVLGNTSYGRKYYEKRKQYVTCLRDEKKKIEAIINTSIPFDVTWEQLNAVYDEYQKLPIIEQRYWSMDTAYAKSTAIPELIADLTLTEDTATPEGLTPQEQLLDQDGKLRELQSKFITCRCSECTICETTRYLCQCPNGLSERIAKKEHRQRVRVVKQKIRKGVDAYFSRNFCTRIDEIQSLKKYRPRDLIDRCKRIRAQEIILTRELQLEKKQWYHKRTAEAQGKPKYRKILRCLYEKYNDHSSPRIGDDKILSWFNTNPEQKAAAINALEQSPGEVRLLFKPGTLEFRIPATFKAIPCRVTYYEIKPFNRHLRALAGGKKGNVVPLGENNEKGAYLHGTFCLACRTNFGQRRELKAHIEKTHQAKMEETFARIRAIRHQPTDAFVPTGGDELPSESIGAQLAEASPGCGLPPLMDTLFGHLSV